MWHKKVCAETEGFLILQSLWHATNTNSVMAYGLRVVTLRYAMVMHG